MDAALLMEYGWVLFVLVVLEGILAADNAVVMAVMVKHLPKAAQKKALFYGLAGAFLFRFLALFILSFLVNVWQVQAIGGLYLLYIMVNHFIKKWKGVEKKSERPQNLDGASLWLTVLKVELADIAFAIDSMLASVAMAITLRPVGGFQIGGIDGGQFAVMFLGGVIGLVLMRFAASGFVKMLEKYPTLETAAFLIVGWVGVKLVIFTLAHPKVQILDEHFPESAGWKAVFWGVLIAIAVVGYIVSRKKEFVKENFGG